MKKHIFLIIGFAVMSVLVAVPMVLAADSGNYGLNDTASAAGLSQQGDVATIIGNIIGTGLSLISVLFFIMMIYGGIMWMTARGKDEVSKKALDVIFSAIIGIIIVLSAYAITTFVFKSVGAGGSSGNTGGSSGGGTTSVSYQVYNTLASDGCTSECGYLCLNLDKDDRKCEAKMNDGECVKYTGESSGNWRKVEYGGQTGWSHSNYLRTSSDCP